MSREKKRLGRDALVSCYLRYIHPTVAIQTKYPNPTITQRLNGMKVLRLEVKKVNRKDQLCVIVSHPDFSDSNQEPILLHIVKRWVTVESEGPNDLLFNINYEQEPNLSTAAEENENQIELPNIAQVENVPNEVINDPAVLAAFQDIGNVDDDDEPVADNIHNPNENLVELDQTEWGYNGICDRRASSGVNRGGASLVHHDASLQLTHLQLFEILFPTDFVKNVIITETNKKLKDHMSYSEWLLFLGINLEMCTQVGFERRSYWATDSIGKRAAPYSYREIMTRDRFEEILRNIQFTSFEPPQERDRFWEVREMIEAWNTNMERQFKPSYLNCIDESMSKWVNKWTCPGFMIVPRKPWPFGNEYHTIACASSFVLFRMELQEGKDEPPNRRQKQFSEHGKMAGKILRLTKPLHNTNSIVIGDSGFCVVKAVKEAKVLGVHTQFMIKKRRYWPKYIDGDEISNHFSDKNIGDYDRKRFQLEGTDLYTHCMKEDGYVLSVVSSFGTDTRMGNWQTRGEHRFQYPEIIHNHYQYRGVVDTHNSRRMYPIAIEEQWKTIRWPLRVFQFLLAVTEVNTNYARNYFYTRPLEDQITFRYYLAQEMKNNDNGSPKRASSRAQSVLNRHEHLSIPPNHTFAGTQLVPCKTDYIQRMCSICKKKNQRKYCSCSLGIIRCNECFKKHFMEETSCIYIGGSPTF